MAIGLVCDYNKNIQNILNHGISLHHTKPMLMCMTRRIDYTKKEDVYSFLKNIK